MESVSAPEALGRLFEATSPEEIRDGIARCHPRFALDRLDQVAVAGAGPEGRRFVEACARESIRVAGLFDSDPAKQGMRIHGIEVRPFEDIGSLGRDVPIVLATHRLQIAADRIDGAADRPIAPLSLLQVIEPDRFPPHMFFDRWCEALWQGRERLAALYDRFADDVSRQALEAVLAFRMSLDMSHLRAVVDWNTYDPPGLIDWSDDEVFVDGGAFAGDTLEWFLERVHHRYERAICFEPDPATFKELSRRFGQRHTVDLVNKGLWSSADTLRFSADGSRASLLDDQGSVDVPVTSVDEVLQGRRATYIKMNIEGAELEALEGARSTIASWRPRMAISAYHRPHDLWEVPERLIGLNPDYSIHLRQHDVGVIETVAYAL